MMGLTGGAKSITTPNSPKHTTTTYKQIKRSDKSNGSYGEYPVLDDVRLENVNIPHIE